MEPVQPILLRPVESDAPLTLEEAIAAFTTELEAKNRSQATITAYRCDLSQFASFLKQTNYTAQSVDQVERADISEYLADLGRQGLSGITRARKLAAIRELFRFLEGSGVVHRSPAIGLETPKKEKRSRAYHQPDEYRAMLSQAGGNPRDFCVLQLFLQTGLRLSELCQLKIADLDLKAGTLLVRAGKGMQDRELPLEKKAIRAIKSYLDIRPKVSDDSLFLNQYAEPISPRGVQKLVTKYTRAAGITKKAGVHALRHTFATIKAKQEVSPFRLRKWLGHARLDTTQIYVHMAEADDKKVMEATSL
jgi:integrase/recombinase XerC